MKKEVCTKKEKLLFWAPRVLGIIFCIIAEMAILFSHKPNIATLIENVFVMLLLVLLVFSWRFPFSGGIVYILLGVFYFANSIGFRSLLVAFVVSSLLIITGVLFILNNEWLSSSKK